MTPELTISNEVVGDQLRRVLQIESDALLLIVTEN